MSVSRTVPRIIAAATITATAATTLVACGDDAAENDAAGNDQQTIRVASSPGPYTELFQDAIEPILAEDGYSVEYINFTDLTQANTALSEGSADLNVEQHSAWMNVFNREQNANLVSITEVPTAPAGLYTEKYTNVDEVADGHSVGVPQDGSNKSRALHMLADVGWITISEDADPTLISEADIAENPHNLDIVSMDSANLARSLPDLDWAVIPGSMSYSAQLDPQLSVFQENLRPELILVAVTTEDKQDQPWTTAVADAYRSDEFLSYMDANNPDNYWFVPDSLK
ncbi:MetQ/NlpA family ABC transporter substrate-binding protein [Corynebacterium timonense]|uniref:D-methionine transport system substrate-binding protein n=1 Tax=Corynebacterium timonense TaxID=441500 RepID=A0A1H1T210_9CORY|nr:MetQ/NlpA family ABC transporter substrate-binding protein [Corynebacterium timonense]SDS54260.1 D-methionine transport system substrate-binding protein [Corynebacterium timonense]